VVTKASLQLIRQASKKNTAQEPVVAHWLSRTEENGEQPVAEQN
jgi:hypothetical protein